MNRIEYRFRDRSRWGSGPWQDEPDKVQWPDEATGLPCLAVRGPGGHWCGYVGVAEGHRCFKVDCDGVDADVHGGLTFASLCAEDGEHGICHIPGSGEPDHVWWLGFDCAHLCDISPEWSEYGRSRWRDYDAVYRDLPYVQRECARLAAQLAQQAA